MDVRFKIIQPRLDYEDKIMRARQVHKFYV